MIEKTDETLAGQTLKVGPLAYQIEIVRELRSESGSYLFGQIDYDRMMIRIDEKYKDCQRTPFILWHEVVHAILDQAAQHEVSEATVEVLALGIVDALRQNKLLRV